MRGFPSARLSDITSLSEAIAADPVVGGVAESILAPAIGLPTIKAAWTSTGGDSFAINDTPLAPYVMEYSNSEGFMVFIDGLLQPITEYSVTARNLVFFENVPTSAIVEVLLIHPRPSPPPDPL